MLIITASLLRFHTVWVVSGRPTLDSKKPPVGGTVRTFTLPLSNYLVSIIRKRIEANEGSRWLFPSATSESGHIAEPKEPGLVKQLEQGLGFKMTFHCLRTTFISVAGLLQLPLYTIKLLVNHALPERGDVTEGYMDHVTDDLVNPMQQISARLIQHIRSDRDES